MSEHQPAGNAKRAPVPEPRVAQDSGFQLPEPDFSRLRMARESLDAAFPQD